MGWGRLWGVMTQCTNAVWCVGVEKKMEEGLGTTCVPSKHLPQSAGWKDTAAT